MFSFLKKSSKPEYTDKVWKTQAACHKGLATEALKLIAQGRIPFVFFFFKAAKEKFVEFLINSGAPHFVVDTANCGEANQQGRTIFILDAFLVSSPAVRDALLRKSKGAATGIFFFGHYPLIEPERIVLEKLEELMGPLPVAFCGSLEDGLLQNFGSERIKPLIESLGMADDECIEHGMVSKAIFRAREKLGEKVSSEIKTDSELKWFELNIKSIL